MVDKLKITKFGHSCVLVQVDDRVALFNPGKWSDYDLASIERVDRLVITHEHGDHLDITKVKQLAGQFPDMRIVVNKSIQNILQEAGVQADITQETMCTRPFSVEHDSLASFGFDVPKHSGYHFKGVFTEPGDTHAFSESKAVLALPIAGPWGHAVGAVEAMLKSKPQHVFLIHDWHLSRDGFDWYQDIVEGVCKENNINFIRIENGTTFEVDL